MKMAGRFYSGIWVTLESEYGIGRPRNLIKILSKYESSPSFVCARRFDRGHLMAAIKMPSTHCYHHPSKTAKGIAIVAMLHEKGRGRG